MKSTFYLFLGLFLLNNCQNPQEDLRGQIRQTEKAFNDMAQEKGVKAAFLHFAADSAVIVRGKNVIKGKAAIGAFFDAQPFVENKLSWSPDFVEVSSSGDMAYTYGKYEFYAVDTSGKTFQSDGIFHTVWKRQADGEWRFVYD